MTEEQAQQQDISESHNRSVKPAPVGRRQRTMLVRYGKMNIIGHFSHNEREIPAGVTHVIIGTDRGLEIGEIISPSCHPKGTCMLSKEVIDEYCQKSGPDYPLTRLGKVLRFANEQDLRERYHMELGVVNEMSFCQQLIEEFKLEMTLVDAEHLFGGERIIFYFMSEGRIDFRELVKRLAQQYQTRIEMRQVGARDEARLIADFETCGRECCCRNFLKILQPVNMRMAKLQKATLDPSKISGRCGRLKCCLRYEDQVYSELNRKLPRRNSCVLTDSGAGVVIEAHVLTQLVKVRLVEGRIIAVNVDEIKEFNYKIPEAAQQSEPEKQSEIVSDTGESGVEKGNGEEMSAERAGAEPRDRLADEINIKQEEESQDDSREDTRVEQAAGTVEKDGKSDSDRPRKRRRRRRRKKPPGSSGNNSGGQS